MKFVIFGLTITSSWGNGHATLWRGLCRALLARGHEVTFFERDVPYYANARDLTELPGADIHLYASWPDVSARARAEFDTADVAMVTSYCPDGITATNAVLSSRAQHKLFYDLDTPVTLAALKAGQELSYIGPRGLRDFDLVLSFTGGSALDELERRLGARRVDVLYGHVDPTLHRPVPRCAEYASELSYLGTYAPDRQAALERLFFSAATELPAKRFLVGGSMYPDPSAWPTNVRHVAHVPPALHPEFFCSSRLTLNVTRNAMASMGYCPSGRLFEAAACGVPLISDSWEGLALFYAPGTEILVAESGRDVEAALTLSDRELDQIAKAARERTLQEHTALCRVVALERSLEALSESNHVPRGSRASMTAEV